jgi:hypothetical protein
VAAAERDVAVVAADLDRRALLHRAPVLVDAQVHRRLAPAIADRLQLDQGVGEREQMGAPLEQIGLEIGAQAVGEDRDVELVADRGELDDLGAGQELGLVEQDAVELALLQLLLDLGADVGAIVVEIAAGLSPMREAITPCATRSSSAAV